MIVRRAIVNPRSRLIVRLCWGVALLCWTQGPSESRADWARDRQPLDAAFRERLTNLATKCRELKLSAQATLTSQWFIERDSNRQYLFLLPRLDAQENVADKVVRQWQAKWMKLRREHADQLFTLAGQASADGAAAAAYQLLHEVLRENPAHEAAAKVLGVRLKSRGVQVRVRRGRRPHPKWGWAAGQYWSVESAHFLISTNTSRQAAIQLTEELEELHSVWRQLFFEFWSTPAALAARLNGRADPLGRQPHHTVVLFASRDEYVEKLRPMEPKIVNSIGYYMPDQATAFFYSGTGARRSTRFHEVTHQLFHETGVTKRDAGEDWNFWVVEGIAVYMESLRRFDALYTVGGFDAERLQYARARRFSGEFFMPFAELVALGRSDLLARDETPQIYSQSAGLAHCLMDYNGGEYRQPFMQYLAAVYVRQDRPGSLLEYLDLSAEELSDIYVESLQVDDEDLRFLPSAFDIEYLALGRTRITDARIMALAGVRELKQLDLSHTRITGDALRVVAELGELKELDLSSTTVSDEAIELLTGLSKLEFLGLANTAISDRALTQLRKMPQLKRVELKGTEVTPDARKSFLERN